MIIKTSISKLEALLVVIVASFLFSQPLLAIDAEIEQAVANGDWQRVAQFYESKDLSDDPVAAKLYVVSCFAANCEEMLLTSLLQTPDESMQSDFSIWCRAMREKNPESADVAFVSGVANLSPTSIDSALLYFDRAIELDSQYALVQAVKGFARLMYQNDPKSAQISFAKSITIDSTLALGRLGHGMAHLYSGEYELAISDFQSTLAIEPNILDARLCNGVALVHLDRPDDAKRLFDEILGKYESGLYKLYAARGDLFTARGLYRSAIWDYTTALAHFDSDIEEYIRKGSLVFDLSRDADQYNRRYFGKNRREPHVGPFINVIVGRGECFRESQVYDSAISDFSRSLKLLRHRQKANKRINAFFKNSKIDTKISFIARILLQRGMTYFAKGDYKKSGSDFGNVIKEAPEAIYAHYWKALCLEKRGKKKKAKKTFVKFLERATASDSILVAKAKTHIAEIEKK